VLDRRGRLISDSNDDCIVQMSGKFLAAAFKLNSLKAAILDSSGNAPVDSVDPALTFQQRSRNAEEGPSSVRLSRSALKALIGFVLQTGKTRSRRHRPGPLDLVFEKYNL
jgi:hypothetical protein